MAKNIIFKWIGIIIGTALIVAIMKWLFLSSINHNMFWFSLCFNFTCMSWIGMIELQLRLKLMSSYYNSYYFENGGKIYIFLGVNQFRWVLNIIGWEKIRKLSTPVSRDLNALEKYERFTRSGEFGHAIAAIIVLALTIYVYVSYGFRYTVWLVIFNILLNIYPIILQRYNRPRIRAIIKQFLLDS